MRFWRLQPNLPGEKVGFAQLPLHRWLRERRTEKFDVPIVAGTGFAGCLGNEFAIFGATKAYGRIVGARSSGAVRNENRRIRLHDAEGNGRLVLDRFAGTENTENYLKSAVDNGQALDSQHTRKGHCNCKHKQSPHLPIAISIFDIFLSHFVCR